MNRKNFRAILPENLVIFLKEKKVLTAYVNNTISCLNCIKNESFLDIRREEILGCITKGNAISAAFVWEDTKEGEDFWSNLSDEYRIYFNKK